MIKNNRFNTLEQRVAILEKAILKNEVRDRLHKRIKNLVSDKLGFNYDVSSDTDVKGSYITISDINEDDGLLDTERDNFEVYRVIDKGTSFEIVVYNSEGRGVSLGEFTNANDAANTIVEYRLS